VKIIRDILVGIFSVVALVFGLIFYSFSRTIPLKDRQPLSGGAVQVKAGMVSVGLIPSGDGQVMLVDCGNDPMAKAILVGLSQMGLGHEAVRTILLPHARPDHIAGCTAFPDAEVFAMAAEQSLLEGRTAARSPIGFLLGKKNSGIRVTRDLSSCRLISTRQRHGDFVLGPRAYRRQRGLSDRGNTLPGRQRWFW
jgi:ribonuclease BN (tRNA processing enzyme)